MAELNRRHYLSLVWQKSLADLFSEARRGYLGVLWWLLEPLLYLTVFYFVFTVIFEHKGDNAVSFLLIGLVVWKWFASVVTLCAGSVASNAGLIGQVYVPKILFPIMAHVSGTLKFLFVLVVLLLYLALVLKVPLSAWIYLPIILGVQIIFMFGVGVLLASISPFFPDTRLLLDNGLLLLFFLSGVFFDITSLPDDIKYYLYFNPMLGLISAYRECLLGGGEIDWVYMKLIVLGSLISMFVGMFILRRYDRVYPKVL